jgi:hypothetical protein
MALAQKQFDVAGQHIREMREMNATDGEIQRAQIEATKNFALAALDAETKKRAELIDLAKQQRDEESKTARANYDNARRLGDAVAGEQERRERDTLQRQIKMAEALGLKSSGGQVATAFTVEQLRIAAAQMHINAEYDTAMALAQKQFDVAGQHIREMREMNATDGEIQRAQIEATKNFALAALDAETKKRAELIDLAKQQRDEESKTAPPWMIAEG